MEQKHVRVLLIEDNAGDVRLIREALKEASGILISLEHTDRLSTGLEYLKNNDADIILLDLGLPDSSGFDTILTVCAQVPDIPVVVLTGLNDEELAIEAIQRGAQDYLVKGRIQGDLLSASIQYAMERKRIEVMLRRKESSLSTLINHNADAIIAVSRDGIIRFVNRSAETLFDRTENDFLGQNFGFPAVAGETTEIEIIRRDGKSIIAEMRVVEAEWESETVYLASLRDITERRRMEKALRDSEEKMRHMFQSVNDGIIIADFNGIIVEANEKAVEMHGFKSKDEIIGKFRNEFIATHNAEIIQREDGKRPFNDGETADLLEINMLKADGREFPGELSFSLLRDATGSPAGIVCVIRDITERKRAEEKFRVQRELTSRIISSTPNPVLVLDNQLFIKLANRTFYETFKLDRDMAEGMPVADVLPLEGLIESLSKTLANGTRHLNLEFTQQTDNGKLIYVAQILPMLEEEKELLLILRDVTAERNMQQQLYHTRTMASIGEMASGVAHEINNPLTSVIGFAQLLMQRDVDENLKEDLKVINDGAQRVASIVKRLLTFARQHKPERGYIDINEIIKVTLNLRKYELDTGNIEVITQYDPELPYTMADAGQIQQVFLNILINAEVAMKSNNGRGRLLIKTERNNDAICVSFKDNGPGISKDGIDKIFNPFFTTKAVGEGTGLGLSICHGIIAEHNGKIYVKSETGQGATFFVELPVTNHNEQLFEPETAEEEPKKTVNARILIVDDEDAVRKYLSRFLTAEGYTVECTNNADDALNMIRNNSYGLILLDIKMPGINGIEMYRRLQGIDQSLARKVIFVTGDVMAPDISNFISKEKASCIAKPFDNEQLRNEINEVLDQF